MAERPPSHYELNELRQWVQVRLEKPGGIRCPVCAQHAQAYKRKITKSMVNVMGRMLAIQGERMLSLTDAIKPGNTFETDASGKRWVHLPHVKQESRDATMLAYWGLIEEWSVVREDGGRAGYWRVTDEGIEFLKGEMRVFTYAHVYRGERYAFSGDQITVHDVAPKFNLNDLMKGE